MCDYAGCDDPATMWGPMDGELCDDCMEREVEDGEWSYDDYVAITDTE